MNSEIAKIENEICKKVAEIYTGKDWHKLSSNERELEKMLERGGYIIPKSPPDGFVGKIPSVKSV